MNDEPRTDFWRPRSPEVAGTGFSRREPDFAPRESADFRIGGESSSAPFGQARPRPRDAAARILRLGAALTILAATAAGGGVFGGLATLRFTDGGPPPAGIATGAPVAQLLSASPGVDGTQHGVVDVVRATRAAVVTVQGLRFVRRGRADPEYVPVQSGSGVVFDPRGYVATNHHVIQGSQSIEVLFLDGRRAPAQLIGHDSENFDIAILKVEGPVPAIAPLADSSLLEPGMQVVAIGSPLGTDYMNTVTTGIVAGLNRSITVSETRFDRRTGRVVQLERALNAAPLIQTDAAINSGNSGGPLINMQGEVVGLNTLVVRSGAQAPVEGLGLAVPSNVVRALADEWIDGLPRPSLGISFVAVTPDVARENDLAQAGGAMVADVEPGSVADSAGLQKGDVIVAIDDTLLDLDRALTDLLWRYRAGNEVRLTVRRGAEEFDVPVVLGAISAQR